MQSSVTEYSYHNLNNLYERIEIMKNKMTVLYPEYSSVNKELAATFNKECFVKNLTEPAIFNIPLNQFLSDFLNNLNQKPVIKLINDFKGISNKAFWFDYFDCELLSFGLVCNALRADSKQQDQSKVSERIKTMSTNLDIMASIFAPEVLQKNDKIINQTENSPTQRVMTLGYW
jgi:hypothetical protein